MKWSLHDSWSVRRWSHALMVALMLASQLTLAQDLPAMTGHGSQMLDAGEHHACAIREDGSLGCWGVVNDHSIEPPAGTFAAVSVGAHMACGLRADGELACWGDPAPASPPSGPFLAVSAGRGEACALRPDGMLACWGGAMAAAAPGGNGHVDVGVADGRGCAIRADGSLECWQAAGVSGYGPAPTGRFLAVDLGDTHACALRSNGQIACWGANQLGQINAPAGAFLAVTVGGDHSCAIRIDGALACWGDNAAQQLAAPAGRFTALAAGSSHTCARRESGTIVCWGGDGSRGELNPPGGAMYGLLTLGGNGEIVCFSFVSENRSDTDTHCVGSRVDLIPPAQPFITMSLGDNSGCGLLRDGSAQCWGAPLGAVPEDQRFQQVSVGGRHACAINHQANIICWGDNGFGQATAPAGTYMDIASGENFTCALRGHGPSTRIQCWGAGPAVADAPLTGEFSELSAGGGNVCAYQYHAGAVCWGETAATITPPPFYNSGLNKIVVGDNHVCAIRNFDSMVCWGSNAQGQLIRPSVERVSVLAAAGDTACTINDQDVICWGARPHTFTLPVGTGRFGTGAIAVGEHHSCTLRSSGQTRCWGDGDLGQREVPQGYKRVLTAGGDHACAIGGDGTLACWGDDTHAGATPVSDVVRSAEAGHFNGCAVRGDGEGACWGWNSNGQGTPPTGPYRALATGLNHSCGVRDDGSLACWGYNADGQASAPAGAFASVDVGERHSCAVDGNGGLQCWGLSSEGQAAPPVASGVTYRTLASGAFHNCAIRSDGGLACWGRNDRGQATPPPGMFVSVSAGFAHTCAIRDNGARVCWGDNDSGQAPQLSITPQTLTSGVIGTFYEVQLGAQSGGAYTPAALGFAVVAGALPSGIEIAGTRAMLAGEPDVPGTYAFTLEVTDANGLSGRREYQLTVSLPPDNTPPVVVPIFDGWLGDNGWYRSDVRLRWSITDPETPVTSTSNCHEQLVTVDTSNWLQPCIARSSGGETWGWASIRRDATPPGISELASGSPNAAGWYNTSVTYAYTCFDWLSGVVSCPASETVSQEGIGLIVASKTIRDNAGNTAATLEQTHNIDSTPPVVVVTPIGTANNDGWYRDLTLQFSCSDALSGLANPCPGQQEVTAEGWSVSAGTNVTDRAGNTTSSFATYKIDRSPPFFQFPSLPYPVRLNANLTVTLNATDYLSGVASASCTPLETATGGREDHDLHSCGHGRQSQHDERGVRRGLRHLAGCRATGQQLESGVSCKCPVFGAVPVIAARCQWRGGHQRHTAAQQRHDSALSVHGRNVGHAACRRHHHVRESRRWRLSTQLVDQSNACAEYLTAAGHGARRRRHPQCDHQSGAEDPHHRWPWSADTAGRAGFPPDACRAAGAARTATDPSRCETRETARPLTGSRMHVARAGSCRGFGTSREWKSSTGHRLAGSTRFRRQHTRGPEYSRASCHTRKPR